MQRLTEEAGTHLRRPEFQPASLLSGDLSAGVKPTGRDVEVTHKRELTAFHLVCVEKKA